MVRSFKNFGSFFEVKITIPDLDVQPQRLRKLNKPVRIVVTSEKYDAFKGVLAEEELTTNIEAAFASIVEIPVPSKS